MGKGYLKKSRTMKRVEIPWVYRMHGANQSILLHGWCKEKGLNLGKDYSWQFKPDECVTVFYFEDHVESYATLFALKWTNNEI
jgi:hypothetical protein